MKLKNFKKLSKTARFKLFVKWVKKQSRKQEYDFWYEYECPLAQFAKYLFGNKYDTSGGTHTIWIDDNHSHDVAPKRIHSELFKALKGSNTFGSLADELVELKHSL